MEEKIESISDLIQILKEKYSAYTEDIWYRGHANSIWTLAPSYLRLDKATSESSLLTRFRQSASMLLSANPKDDFDWLFLMQHYGVPTRLLDWSESPLVSLYFAVTDENNIDEDGALWILKPTELNKIANISTDEINYIPSFDDIELQNYSVESLSSNPKLKLSPIATIATRNSARIQAQLGVFTIHHLDTKPIESFCEKQEVLKYIIPKESKSKIKEELDLLNINKFSLFPELSSISEIIKEKIL